MKIFNIKYAIALIAVAAFTISCDDDDVTEIPEASTNFTGTFVQQDQMGRPGINTVFPTTEADENEFNVTIPSDGIARWQPTFQAKVEALYDAYGATYENNIIGLDLPTLTTALSLDVLQVAPNGSGPTTYFGGTSNFLTGRALNDDVIDVSLILLFGGQSGARFNGDGGTPNLVSDNVGLEAGTTSDSFPYLTAPKF
ncbi:DUF4331 family protein [Nonlabens antarcticus]|uniref:DUF4331 family protein n=1 Tax=Nonlabens antarcticus TaxID=392714 RepID=UPI0018914EA1|nr:DUF4331 family protein [Nonlabens antarcticus]